MGNDERQVTGAPTLRARRGWLSLLLALPLAMALFSGTAAAQDATGNRDFTLNNLTRFDITRVSTSTADSNVWTVLRDSAVPSRTAVLFTFDNVGRCVLQLRVDFDNGSYVAWTDGFDFCNSDTITITYNDNNNTFNARAQ